MGYKRLPLIASLWKQYNNWKAFVVAGKVLNHQPSPPSYVSEWGPTVTGTYFTLSNGNLTATCTRSFNQQIAQTDDIIYYGTGKYYWEVTGNVSVWVGLSDKDFYSAQDYSGLGNFLGGSANYCDFTAITALQLAYDSDSGKLWYGYDDVWAGDPVAGTSPDATIGGNDVRFCGSFSNNSNSLTLNFDDPAYNYTPPSGY